MDPWGPVLGRAIAVRATRGDATLYIILVYYALYITLYNYIMHIILYIFLMLAPSLGPGFSFGRKNKKSN